MSLCVHLHPELSVREPELGLWRAGAGDRPPPLSAPRPAPRAWGTLGLPCSVARTLAMPSAFVPEKTPCRNTEELSTSTGRRDRSPMWRGE